jgi:hypothetical protein
MRDAEKPLTAESAKNNRRGRGEKLLTANGAKRIREGRKERRSPQRTQRVMGSTLEVQRRSLSWSECLAVPVVDIDCLAVCRERHPALCSASPLFAQDDNDLKRWCASMMQCDGWAVVDADRGLLG